MDKVHDTASFINAARRSHGERYDYSETIWKGSQEPIFIICKVHGKFRLSQSSCHYKKNNPCGCRKCNHFASRKKQCPACKKNTLNPSDYLGVCKNCKPGVIADRKKAKAEKKRCCEGCGCVLVDKPNNQKFCSRQCSFETKRNGWASVKVSCVNCGRSIWKDNKKLKYVSASACSFECQRIYAGKMGLKDKLGIKKSREQKKRWKADQSKRRRRELVSFWWWQKCRKSIGKTYSRRFDEWDKKSSTASQTLQTRRRIKTKAKKKKKAISLNWAQAIPCLLSKMLMRNFELQKSEWEIKCSRISSSNRKRFRRLQKGSRSTLTRIQKQARQLRLF